MSAFKPSTETGKDVRAKILFWGPPGAGKTHTALTWPSPALVDLETRGRNFADRFGFQHAEVGTIKQLSEVFQELRSGSVAFDSVVVDSASAIYYKFVVAHTAETERGAFVTDWVTVNRRFLACMDFAFSIAGRNVIFTAHSATKLERTGRDFKVAGTKFVGDDRFRFAFDFIFRIEPHGDPVKNAATFHVEKTASPHIALGAAIRGLDYSKFAALVRGETPRPLPARAVHSAASATQGEANPVPQSVERAGGSNSNGSSPSNSSRAEGGTSAAPPTDDGTPISEDQVCKIEVLERRLNLGQMKLGDVVKRITGGTPLYQRMTSAQAVRLIAILEHRLSEVKGAA